MWIITIVISLLKLEIWILHLCQDRHGGAEVGSKLAEPQIGPAILSDKEEDNAFKGSVSSTDNHSISLEVKL